ncbi:hypothetical protein FB45DRAFT_1116517 [Roridomyces roridus]|uniref:Uncharacterized protein n=1 Tax=Roridomyces roridus TaxID=1738132 RepID=A0AAD7CED2_9AGAR|nr:hypothetical protein FB45DRAFT_1116517 [Roridomyces roridus]
MPSHEQMPSELWLHISALLPRASIVNTSRPSAQFRIHDLNVGLAARHIGRHAPRNGIQGRAAICESLPKLVDLRIDIETYVTTSEYERGEVDRATDFFSALADTPTHTLERLAITWKFNDGMKRLSSRINKIPDFVQMRNSLVVKSPHLKMVWLDGYDFLFGWRRHLDGRVDREEASPRVSSTRAHRTLQSTIYSPLFCNGCIFTGLQKLEARHVYFSQSTLTVLFQFSSFVEINVDRCGVAPTAPIDTVSLQLRTSRFTCRDNWNATRSLELWLPLLNPGHLMELHISGSEVEMDMPDGPLFPRVHTLKAYLRCDTPSAALTALWRFPATRRLEFHGLLACDSDKPPPVMASTLLLVLEEYVGDDVLLQLIPPRPFTRCVLQYTTTAGLESLGGRMWRKGAARFVEGLLR